MSAPPTPTTLTTLELAEQAGISQHTAWRWAQAWHGKVGSGRALQATEADVRVARAWRAINDEGPRTAPARRLQGWAELAIRRQPGLDWLLVTDEGAEAHPTAAAAATAWLATGERPGWLINVGDPA